MLQFLLSFLSKLTFFTGMIRKNNAFPPPLSPEEEKEALERMQQGDESARDKLIEHNLRLVAHVVKKYANAYETDDLISVGSIGLMKAVATYNPEKGSSLATFAARCIENEILMLFRSTKKFRNDVSLSDPVGVDKDGNELTLLDLLSEKEDSVFEAVETRVTAAHLAVIMKRVLTDREYQILSLRYGLKGGVPLAQREVAERLGISRSYISRIEARAVQKIRAAVEETP